MPEEKEYVIYTKKKGSTGKEFCDTELIGADFVKVGVDTGQQTVYHDDVSGLNMAKNIIEAKTIYDIKYSTIQKKNYFRLDLETGRGGKSWYPGSKRVCDIVGEDVPIKIRPSLGSETLLTVSNIQKVDVLDVVLGDQEEVWYKITYNEVEGYVQSRYIENIRYIDQE